jgi:hypothetical protein
MSIDTHGASLSPS